MRSANWNYLQYLDVTTMSNMSSGILSGIGEFNSVAWNPGLIRPDVINISASALSATVSMPAPFGVLFSGGFFSKAHGSVNGFDSQTATVSFAPLVPASGPSVTAYLIASYGQILQNPITIPGPPPGTAAYNPTFSATVGYTTIQDTLLLSATTGAPDNLNTFELARFSLYAGQTGLVNPITQYQVLSSPGNNTLIVSETGTGTLNMSAGQCSATLAVSGYSQVTIPVAATARGLAVNLYNLGTSGITVQTNGELIYGYRANVSGITSLTLQPYDALEVRSFGSAWQVVGGSPGGMGVGAYASTYQTFIGVVGAPISGSYTFPNGVYQIYVQIWGAGGGGGGGDVSGTAMPFGANAAGGGGGYVAGVITGFPGTTINYTLGGGGIGGVQVSGGSNGTGGGTTSVGNLMIASGGGPGKFTGGTLQGGSGGSAGGSLAGITYMSGSAGTIGFQITNGYYASRGGASFGCSYSHDSAVTSGQSGGGVLGIYYGQGGGGGVLNQAGGNGWPGVVVIMVI